MQQRKPDGYELSLIARPSPGMWAAVFDGPQVGVRGFIRKHVRSKFAGAAPAAGDDGRAGYRVEIATADGQFVWVGADQVDVFVKSTSRRNRFNRYDR